MADQHMNSQPTKIILHPYKAYVGVRHTFNSMRTPIVDYTDVNFRSMDTPLLRWCMYEYYVPKKVTEDIFWMSVANVMNFCHRFIFKQSIIDTPYTFVMPKDNLSSSMRSASKDPRKKPSICDQAIESLKFQLPITANTVLNNTRQKQIVDAKELVYDTPLLNFLHDIRDITCVNPFIFCGEIADILMTYYTKFPNYDGSYPIFSNPSFIYFLLNRLELWNKYRSISVSVDIHDTFQKCLGPYNNRFKPGKTRCFICLNCYDATNFYVAEAYNYTDEFRTDITYTCSEKSVHHWVIPMVMLNHESRMIYAELKIRKCSTTTKTITMYIAENNDLAKCTMSMLVDGDFVKKNDTSQDNNYRCDQFTIAEACVGCYPIMKNVKAEVCDDDAEYIYDDDDCDDTNFV